jgi:hypothetical protein
MNTLLHWLSERTPEERKRFRESAGITRDSLHQMAHGYRTGGELRISPEIARRMEIASRAIGPQLRREDLSPACGACELAVAGRR